MYLCVCAKAHILRTYLLKYIHTLSANSLKYCTSYKPTRSLGLRLNLRVVRTPRRITAFCKDRGKKIPLRVLTPQMPQKPQFLIDPFNGTLLVPFRGTPKSPKIQALQPAVQLCTALVVESLVLQLPAEGSKNRWF